MIQGLKLINLPSGDPLLKEVEGDVFVLRTCQRTILVGHNLAPFQYVNSRADMEVHEEEMAYQFLLETICGLKSRLVAENEITGQFKEAYLTYLKNSFKAPLIMNVLEKLFKDAKEVRTLYLHNVGQQSYAGMSRHFLKQKKKCGKVLLVGSGSLTKDLIKLLDKHYEIYVSARSEEKIKELLKQFTHKSIKTVSWKDYSSYETFELIVNTIGADDTTIFNDVFFKNWKKAQGEIFVDLGTPSVIKTEMSEKHGVYRLEHVFKEAQKLEKEKEQKVEKAKDHIVKLVEKRKLSFSLNVPFGWEDLHFV